MHPHVYTGYVAVAILLAIVFYYGFAGAKLNTLITRQLVDSTRLARRHGRIEITGVIRLVTAGLLQLIFVLILSILGVTDWRHLVPRAFHPDLLCYGVLLGIGEMSLGSFISNVVMRLVQLVHPVRHSSSKSSWFVAVEGGWMRSFLKTVEIVPMPFAVSAIILYIAMEEVVFRGVVINALIPWGQAAAVSISTVFFVLVQAFHMPSWRSAAFPIVSASVMGPLHGSLYVAVPDLAPLIVAHSTMFIIAIRWR